MKSLLLYAAIFVLCSFDAAKKHSLPKRMSATIHFLNPKYRGASLTFTPPLSGKSPTDSVYVDSNGATIWSAHKGMMEWSVIDEKKIGDTLAFCFINDELAAFGSTDFVSENDTTVDGQRFWCVHAVITQ